MSKRYDVGVSFLDFRRSSFSLFAYACLAAPIAACGSPSDDGDESGLSATTLDTGVSVTSASSSASSTDEGMDSSATIDTSTTADASSTADASATSNDASSTGDGDGDSTSADSGDGDSTGDPEPVPMCLPPCSSAADCVIDNAGPYFDADNYSCDNGGCMHTGCNSDAECEGSIPGYVCRQSNGADTSYCVASCTNADQCAQPTAGPAYDADNYSCDDGGCVWTGCNSDSECAASLAGSACQDFGNGLTACVLTCNAPADCDQGQLAFDSDNYACTDGYCEYLGCNSDSECMEFTDNVCVSP